MHKEDRRFRFPSSGLRTLHKPRCRSQYIDIPSEMRTFDRMPDILQHLLPATTLACAWSFSRSLNLKHIQFQTSVEPQTNPQTKILLIFTYRATVMKVLRVACWPNRKHSF